MAKYVELECVSPGCLNRETWEAFVRFEDDGDGGTDLVVVSDGPGYVTSLECPDCGDAGERI